MIYTHQNCHQGTIVYDIDKQERISCVSQIDTDTNGDAPYTEHKWRGHQHDHRGLQHGLIQLTAEGAIAQAKAMIAAVGGEV